MRHIFPVVWFIDTNVNHNCDYKYFLSAKKLKYLISGLTGIGSGLALMPIFNKELTSLEQFGIDIHANKALFDISTINTLLVVSPTVTLEIHKAFNDTKKCEGTSKQKIVSKVGVILAIIPPMLQLSQLWNVELHNQKVAKSHGFDEYLAWATFTTIPLLTSEFIKNARNVNSFVFDQKQNYKLESLGSKIFVYSTSFLSTVGRAIAYTHAIKEFFINIGCEENFSLSVGIIFGGIIGSSINGCIEHTSIKKLFSENSQNLTKKEIALGVICALEGAWFSLPTISDGLEFAKDWQSFLQVAIFFPTFLSRMINNSNSLYEILSLKEKKSINNDVIVVEPLVDNSNLILDDNNNLLGNNDLIDINDF